ncbi:hypothetical protein PINS_up011513 [Pythium insidiosum]|nr:hypothetical protein PINS_up011513 [Pythium insidiosum]
MLSPLSSLAALSTTWLLLLHAPGGSLVVASASTASSSSSSGGVVADFTVPAFDFAQLSAESPKLLRAMQRDGIVSLKNIPQYVETRSEYLRKAAACAVHAKDHNAEFLLHRRLQDGTERYTISTESGRRLENSGFETVETCPGYQEVYHKFSRVVEGAIASLGRALDANSSIQIKRRLGDREQRMTARELMEDSVHLDHFHAYEAAAARGLESDLTLGMHTDNGLMIAMAAPEYFDVRPSGDVVPRETRSDDAGLIIQTADGKTARPSLRADELVLMLGEGINQWVSTTPKLHPVMHGMQYPRGLSYADDSHRLLRTWFGKMVLLSDDHVMHNTGMTYSEFTNHTSRYLLESHADPGFAAVACPPSRRLQASDNKCALKTCKPKGGAPSPDMTHSCQVTCNHVGATDDEKLCAENCICEESSTPATACWMLCVPHLPTSTCPGEQKCNDAFTMDTLAMTCVGGGGGSGGSSAGRTSAPPAASTSKPPATTSTPKPSATTAKPKGSQKPKPASDSSAATSRTGSRSDAVETPKPSKSRQPTTPDAAANRCRHGHGHGRQRERQPVHESVHWRGDPAASCHHCAEPIASTDAVRQQRPGRLHLVAVHGHGNNRMLSAVKRFSDHIKRYHWLKYSVPHHSHWLDYIQDVHKPIVALHSQDGDTQDAAAAGARAQPRSRALDAVLPGRSRAAAAALLRHVR